MRSYDFKVKLIVSGKLKKRELCHAREGPQIKNASRKENLLKSVAPLVQEQLQHEIKS